MKNLNSKCQVCGSQLDENTCLCNFCGWYQSTLGLDSPDKVIYPNMVSFNKAKRLFSQGNIISPSIDDFFEALKMYSEMQFYYKNTRFGVVKLNDGLIHFYQWNNPDSDQKFDGKAEFLSKANIDGILLKDIWNRVEKATYMECD